MIYDINVKEDRLSVECTLLEANLSLSEQFHYETFLSDAEYKEYIKKQIAERIAAKIANSAISYTYRKNPNTGHVDITARCFLADRSKIDLIKKFTEKTAWSP